MSYGITAALQAAIYTALTGDAALTTLVDGAVFDALPPGPVPSIYVSLGPERVRDRSDKLAGGAQHDLSLTVTSDQAGFQTAKEVAARISDVLDGADLALSRGRLTSLLFTRARARRTRAGREIEIWFRAFVDDAAPV
ncbi:DUF3168 domain-containing protein [Rhodophyticola sp. CCM32]|uniref:DUF3168 domain-containing protein n=1 Tax=Rhodophyticola sp. CCM32 TaxID=2916397 RepID=UPI00107F7ECD|nr:DUF3168 domain-containing protein [Rhodophyticola sp. CCM32]QBX99843.1 DUF3168 domain-containing protein [Rhodophyticola sp. CCM32]